MRVPEPRLWLNSQTGYYTVKYQDDRGIWRRESLRTKDRKEAVRAFNAWKRDHLIHLSDTPVQSDKTVASFLDEWDAHISIHHTPTTVVQYRATAAKLRDALGNVRLVDLTPRVLQQWLDSLSLAGLAAPTVNKHRRHARVILATAEEWGYLARRPKLPRPMRESERIKYFHEDDLVVLLETIDDPAFRDLCEFALATGLRSGEILRLTDEDVDNPRGFLRITEAQKNRTESRIPINSAARAILSRYPGPGRLFPYTSESYVSRKFRRYLTRSGLDTSNTFHSLRHTFGTTLVREGVDIRVIKELMRHKAITSTMVYAKVAPAHLVESAEKAVRSYHDRTKTGLEGAGKERKSSLNGSGKRRESRKKSDS